MKQTFTIAALCLAFISQAQTVSLYDALAEAKANRPAIRSAQLNLDRARLSARALGAFPATQLGIGQSTRADLGATDIDLFISQPIDVFGRSSADRKLGEAGVLAAEAELKATILKVQSEVISYYFEAAAAQHLTESAEGLLDVSESLLTATRRRFEEGKVPEVQVTRAMIERDRAIQTVKLRQSQFRSEYARLVGAIGEVGGELSLESDLIVTFDDENEVTLRPDIMGLESELRAAVAEEVIARRASLPELELIGLRSPWRGEETHFGARLQLTWSCNDFGRKKNEISAARTTADSIRARIEDAKQLAESEIRSIRIELTAALERVDSYQALLDANRVLVQKTHLGFEQGVGTLIDVLESTRSLREIEQELVEAKLAAHLAANSLLESKGILVAAQ